ncbi:hypothetical protein BLA60_29070 [Actinophytocola xinjiangensis]|uniref:DUF998 domain-containing protein n=1 Tax=Actinophytocola xinjiangensis TaxID=485602 RepID=A0A7Z0WI56_9PSEU|nr:DUF998 domain-containing protein [Actinophytocola xinjiangensis]OLF07282.1 hypothetical protein BLA60_29070 [Actinophytocola xinjiangensis]
MDGGTRVPRTRRGPWLGGLLALSAGLSLLSLVAMVRSLATMTYLNIQFASEVDPFSRAVSYYVFYGDGREEFATSVIVLAAGTVLMLVGLRAVGIRLGGAATALFGVWCTSLTLCAIFPTDNGKSIVSTSGVIHQVAGASLFVSLPLAGLTLARRLAGDPRWQRTARVVRRLAMVAMGLAAGYLACRLPDVFPSLAIPGVLDGRGVSGLVQRALFGLEMLILMALAVRLLRVAVSSARESRQPARVEAT